MYVVAKKLKAQAGSGQSPKEWMKDWCLNTSTSIVDSSRHKCFLEVEEMAREFLKNEHSKVLAIRLDSPNPSMKNDHTRIKSAASAADWHSQLFECFCSKYMEELAMILKKRQSKYFVFAFDECSQLGLLHKPPSDKQPSWHPQWGVSLVELERIIKAGDRFNPHNIIFWFLFLDTSPSLFTLLPHVPNTPSFRLTKNPVPLPPWVYLGFNQMVGANHSEGIQKPIDALGMDHLKAYGRPVSNDFHALVIFA
jgi:hypothetical protein